MKSRSRTGVAQMMTPATSRWPRVLLIDADQDSWELYAEALTSAGLEVVTVSDGHGATELVTTLQPAVVVTDVRLRGAIDGLEVTRRLRADDRTKSIPVIVLTADDACYADALASGCERFLTTPCAPAALVSEIRLLIGRTVHSERSGSSKTTKRRTIAARGRKDDAKSVDR
jgi:CheY-like chemotaxis protein